MITANANSAPARRTGDTEPEWMVWITVAVALLIGLFVMLYVTGQTASTSVGGTSLTYPATWQQATEQGAVFAVADLRGGAFGDRAVVRELAKTELLPRAGGLEEAAANWTLAQQEARVGYRVLGVHSVKVQNKDAIEIASAYLMDSPYGTSAVPALMRGIDTIVLSGDKFYVLSYATQGTDAQDAQSANDRLLGSWRLP